MSRLLLASFACVSVCLTTGYLATQATGANDLPLARVWSTVTITSGMASLLLAAGWLWRIMTRHRDFRAAQESPMKVPDVPEYVARYSVSTRISVVIMLLAFLLLIGFFVIHARWPATMISITFLLGLSVLAMEYLFSSVRFSAQGVEHRSAWRSTTRTDWRDVTGISVGVSRVTIHGSAGTRIDLRPGLGNPQQVLAQIRRHCPSVRSEI